jgi:tRNA dimethylallyltransferase
VNKKQILIITGPTGVGKTDLVLSLASTQACEIINVDIGQFYKPFAIGTAKPDWDLEQPLYSLRSIEANGGEKKFSKGVPHLLFDILDTPRSLTVHEYRSIVLQAINEVWARGKLPILVGGSGFYIQSLLFPLPDNIRSEQPSQEDFFDEKNENLWQVLYNIDPQRAQAIDKQDEYRIKRALEIWQKTGKKPSDCLPQFEPPCDFTLLVVDRNRDELYQRINERVVQMIDQGWIDEVKKIKNTEWESFLKIKKLIGYDDILEYLDSDFKDRDVLIETIQQKTRKYAKRQLTFFRMLSSKILINAMNEKESNKIKIIWTNLTLLPDINTLFASLKN